MRAKKDYLKLSLKHPLESYQPRLSRFLQLMMKVKSLKPYDLHLWKVMDGTAVQDTETALEVALLKKKQNPDQN